MDTDSTGYRVDDVLVWVGPSTLAKPFRDWRWGIMDPAHRPLLVIVDSGVNDTCTVVLAADGSNEWFPGSRDGNALRERFAEIAASIDTGRLGSMVHIRWEKSLYPNAYLELQPAVDAGRQPFPPSDTTEEIDDGN